MEKPKSVLVLGLLAGILTACVAEAPPDSGRSSWLGKLAGSSLVEEWRIGELSGAAEYVLGKVSDVAVDAEERVYVVDGMNAVIRAYGPDGRFLASAGRQGEGPGEFTAADRIALGPGDTIYVLDRMPRLSRFALHGSKLEFVDSFSPQINFMDVCLLGDRLAIQGQKVFAEEILHLYSPSGAVLASFGELNAGQNLIIQETFSWGSVVCLPTLPGILYVPRFSPEVRLYRPDGTLIRRDSIPGYRVTPAEPAFGGDGGRFRWSPPAGAHSVRSVATLDNTRVLIQLALRDTTAKAVGEIAELQSLVWSAPEGRALERSSEIPELVVVRGGFAYGRVREPVPQVVKYRIGRQ